MFSYFKQLFYREPKEDPNVVKIRFRLPDGKIIIIEAVKPANWMPPAKTP